MDHQQERISKLGGKSIEFIQTETQRENKVLRNCIDRKERKEKKCIEPQWLLGQGQAF